MNIEMLHIWYVKFIVLILFLLCWSVDHQTMGFMNINKMVRIKYPKNIFILTILFVLSIQMTLNLHHFDTIVLGLSPHESTKYLYTGSTNVLLNLWGNLNYPSHLSLNIYICFHLLELPPTTQYTNIVVRWNYLWTMTSD